MTSCLEPPAKRWPLQKLQPSKTSPRCNLFGGEDGPAGSVLKAVSHLFHRQRRRPGWLPLFSEAPQSSLGSMALFRMAWRVTVILLGVAYGGLGGSLGPLAAMARKPAAFGVAAWRSSALEICPWLPQPHHKSRHATRFLIGYGHNS